MISASESTLSLNNLKISRSKATKNLTNLRKKFGLGKIPTKFCIKFGHLGRKFIRLARIFDIKVDNKKVGNLFHKLIINLSLVD